MRGNFSESPVTPIPMAGSFFLIQPLLKQHPFGTCLSPCPALNPASHSPPIWTLNLLAFPQAKLAPSKNQDAVEEILLGSFWVSWQFLWRDPEQSEMGTVFWEGALGFQGHELEPHMLCCSGPGSTGGIPLHDFTAKSRQGTGCQYENGQTIG